MAVMSRMDRGRGGRSQQVGGAALTARALQRLGERGPARWPWDEEETQSSAFQGSPSPPQTRAAKAPGKKDLHQHRPGRGTCQGVR